MRVESRSEEAKRPDDAPAGGAAVLVRPIETFPRINLRPKLGLGDYALGAWRAKWLMLAVAAPIGAGAVGLALQFPTRYAASVRLLVSPTGAPAANSEALLAESEIAASSAVADSVVEQFGVARLYPGLATKRAAIEAFATDYSVKASANTMALRLTYVNADPQKATDAANAAADAYLAHRRDVLANGGGPALAAQRADVEARLRSAQAELQTFLADHKLADFDIELGAVNKQLGQAAADLYAAEAQLSEARATAASLKKRLGAARPDARREAEADSAHAEAATAALVARSAELGRLKQQAEQRRAELARIEPDFESLRRTRDALAASASTLAARQQGERTGSDGAFQQTRVAIYERAAHADPVSARPMVMIAGIGAAGFAAALAATLRTRRRTGFATAASFERTMGLPVLAVVADLRDGG